MVARPPSPFPQQLSGNLQDQMRRIADSLSVKADITLEPTYTSVSLISPNGTTYKLTVADNGAVAVTAVPRP